MRVADENRLADSVFHRTDPVIPAVFEPQTLEAPPDDPKPRRSAAVSRLTADVSPSPLLFDGSRRLAAGGVFARHVPRIEFRAIGAVIVQEIPAAQTGGDIAGQRIGISFFLRGHGRLGVTKS